MVDTTPEQNQLKPDQLRALFSTAYGTYVTSAQRAFGIEPDPLYNASLQTGISNFIGSLYNSTFQTKQNSGYVTITDNNAGVYDIDKNGDIYAVTIKSDNTRTRGEKSVGNIRQNAIPHPATTALIASFWKDQNAQLQLERASYEERQQKLITNLQDQDKRIRSILGNISNTALNEIHTEFSSSKSTEATRQAMLRKHNLTNPAPSEDSIKSLSDYLWQMTLQNNNLFANDSSFLKLKSDVQRLETAHDLFHFFNSGQTQDAIIQNDVLAGVKVDDNILALRAYNKLELMREGEYLRIEELYANNADPRKAKILAFFEKGDAGKPQKDAQGNSYITREQAYAYVRHEFENVARTRLGSVDKVSQAMYDATFNPYEKDVEIVFHSFSRPSYNDPVLHSLVQRQFEHNNYPGYSPDNNPLNSDSRSFMRRNLSFDEQVRVISKLSASDILPIGYDAGAILGGNTLKPDIWERLTDAEKREKLAPLTTEPRDTAKIAALWNTLNNDAKDIVLNRIVQAMPASAQSDPAFERGIMAYLEPHMGSYMFKRGEDWNNTFGAPTQTQKMQIYLQLHVVALRNTYSKEAYDVFTKDGALKRDLTYEDAISKIPAADRQILDNGINDLNGPSAYMHFMHLNLNKYRENRAQYVNVLRAENLERQQRKAAANTQTPRGAPSDGSAGSSTGVGENAPAQEENAGTKPGLTATDKTDINLHGKPPIFPSSGVKAGAALDVAANVRFLRGAFSSAKTGSAIAVDTAQAMRDAEKLAIQAMEGDFRRLQKIRNMLNNTKGMEKGEIDAAERGMQGLMKRYGLTAAEVADDAAAKSKMLQVVQRNVSASFGRAVEGFSKEVIEAIPRNKSLVIAGEHVSETTLDILAKTGGGLKAASGAAKAFKAAGSALGTVGRGIAAGAKASWLLSAAGVALGGGMSLVETNGLEKRLDNLEELGLITTAQKQKPKDFYTATNTQAAIDVTAIGGEVLLRNKLKDMKLGAAIERMVSPTFLSETFSDTDVTEANLHELYAKIAAESNIAEKIDVQGKDKVTTLSIGVAMRDPEFAKQIKEQYAGNETALAGLAKIEKLNTLIPQWVEIKDPPPTLYADNTPKV